MNGSWKTAACVVALTLAFGIFVLCVSGAWYLGRAAPPDTVEIGVGASAPKCSFWMGIRGKKLQTAKKTISTFNDDDPSCK